MDYTKETQAQMDEMRKKVKFETPLSEKQKAALVAQQNTLTGLDTMNGLTIFPLIEDCEVLYWGDESVEMQIIEICSNCEN